MFTHVMIGSNDLEKARAFYDATFVALGAQRGETDARGRLIYVHEGGRLMITKPIDGKPATAANGGTIGIAAASPNHVLAWHVAGTANGGTSIETPPVRGVCRLSSRSGRQQTHGTVFTNEMNRSKNSFELTSAYGSTPNENSGARTGGRHPTAEITS
jgi:catechol 2,3-dioxygenase-like lactoylglutathione lyase family enzyme